jgi:hypothetical protein
VSSKSVLVVAVIDGDLDSDAGVNEANNGPRRMFSTVVDHCKVHSLHGRFISYTRKPTWLGAE